MAPYTVIQFIEVVVFGAVLLYGLLAHRPSVAVLGGGLLIGKAVLNILAPEGGTLYRRSLVGYALGGLFVIAGVTLVKLLE